MKKIYAVPLPVTQNHKPGQHVSGIPRLHGIRDHLARLIAGVVHGASPSSWLVVSVAALFCGKQIVNTDFKLTGSAGNALHAARHSPQKQCRKPPRESASIFADYLRSLFSVSQPTALRIRARGYLSELRRATWPVESHSSFCSSYSPAQFLVAASNLYSSTATGPKLPIPC